VAFACTGRDHVGADRVLDDDSGAHSIRTICTAVHDVDDEPVVDDIRVSGPVAPLDARCADPL
jgi:hypothetical protein